MMSQIPVDFKKLSKKELNCCILRAGITSELDAINLYEQLAAICEDAGIKKVLQDIAKEEKTHVGEFQALLLKEDADQKTELKNGQTEVEELI